MNLSSVPSCRARIRAEAWRTDPSREGPPFAPVEEEESFSLNCSEFLAKTPVIKDRLTREEQISLLTCVPPVDTGDTQGKMSNSLRWFRIQA